MPTRSNSDLEEIARLSSIPTDHLPLSQYLAVEEELFRQFLAVKWLDTGAITGDVTAEFERWLQIQTNENLPLRSIREVILRLSPNDIKRLQGQPYDSYAVKLPKKYRFEKLVGLVLQNSLLLAALNNLIQLLLALNVELPLTLLLVTPFFEHVLSAAFVSLTLGAFVEVFRAAFFEKSQRDRALVIVGGLVKAGFALTASLISLGALSANPFVLPFMLYGYMITTIFVETRQLAHVLKEKQRLGREIEQIEAERLVVLPGNLYPEQNLSYPRLSLDLLRIQREIAVLEIERSTLVWTRNLRVIGLISASLFLAACFFPPASVAACGVMVAALSLWVVMSVIIQRIQGNAKDKIAIIKDGSKNFELSSLGRLQIREKPVAVEDSTAAVRTVKFLTDGNEYSLDQIQTVQGEVDRCLEEVRLAGSSFRGSFFNQLKTKVDKLEPPTQALSPN